jgi:serine/threonine protein kinase
VIEEMETPKTIGRYEIVDEIGQGAMGSVFRAHDPAMDRTVALKTILTGALAGGHGAEFRQRFYREARAAGALAHPGIVPVFDVGENDGQPFLVMEYVNGRTLADAMKNGERVSMDRVCEIGQQLAEALGHAHRKGVIHRDIKPANILMTNREAYGIERPRITDFGVAKMMVGEITTTGQMLGTPAFMPPEQFTGAPIDGRTDLFSLGVILYWMATGEQPFPGETMTTVSYKIVHTEPVPPARLNPLVPAQLDKVIMKCLSKSPADRYQSGEELAQALAEVRSGATPASLQTVIPETTMGNKDELATLDAVRSLPPKRVTNSGSTPAPVAGMTEEAVAMTSTKPLPVPPPKPSAKKRTGRVAAVAAALIAVAGAAGWFGMHNHNHAETTGPAQASAPQAVQTVQPAPAPEATQATETSAAAPNAVSTAKKPPAGQPKSAAQPAAGTKTAAATPPASQPAPAPSAATPQPNAAAAALPRMAPVTFNPKTLEPKQNTRLKLDVGHVPSGMAFEIEMNGKLLLKSTAGSKADYDTIVVPPGMHEFKVMVSSGGTEKSSNTVSAEFIAKKRMVLKVEVRLQPNGAPAGSAGLGSGSQVVATLKEDHFFL